MASFGTSRSGRPPKMPTLQTPRGGRGSHHWDNDRQSYMSTDQTQTPSSSTRAVKRSVPEEFYMKRPYQQPWNEDMSRFVRRKSVKSGDNTPQRPPFRSTATPSRVSGTFPPPPPVPKRKNRRVLPSAPGSGRRKEGHASSNVQDSASSGHDTGRVMPKTPAASGPRLRADDSRSVFERLSNPAHFPVMYKAKVRDKVVHDKPLGFGSSSKSDYRTPLRRDRASMVTTPSSSMSAGPIRRNWSTPSSSIRDTSLSTPSERRESVFDRLTSPANYTGHVRAKHRERVARMSRANANPTIERRPSNVFDRLTHPSSYTGHVKARHLERVSVSAGRSLPTAPRGSLAIKPIREVKRPSWQQNKRHTTAIPTLEDMPTVDDMKRKAREAAVAHIATPSTEDSWGKQLAHSEQSETTGNASNAGPIKFDFGSSARNSNASPSRSPSTKSPEQAPTQPRTHNERLERRLREAQQQQAVAAARRKATSVATPARGSRRVSSADNALAVLRQENETNRVTPQPLEDSGDGEVMTPTTAEFAELEAQVMQDDPRSRATDHSHSRALPQPPNRDSTPTSSYHVDSLKNAQTDTQAARIKAENDARAARAVEMQAREVKRLERRQRLAAEEAAQRNAKKRAAALQLEKQRQQRKAHRAAQERARREAEAKAAADRQEAALAREKKLAEQEAAERRRAQQELDAIQGSFNSDPQEGPQTSSTNASGSAFLQDISLALNGGTPSHTTTDPYPLSEDTSNSEIESKSDRYEKIRKMSEEIERVPPAPISPPPDDFETETEAEREERERLEDEELERLELEEQAKLQAEQDEKQRLVAEEQMKKEMLAAAQQKQKELERQKEQERIKQEEIERIEEEKRIAAERQEVLAKEARDEAERVAAEKVRSEAEEKIRQEKLQKKQEEMERLAEEERCRKDEHERIEAEAKARQERLEQEIAQAALAAEKAEQEAQARATAAIEQAAREAEEARVKEKRKIEEEAVAARKAEMERIAAEAEAERIARLEKLKEEAEAERIAHMEQVRKEAEAERLAQMELLRKEAEDARMAQQAQLEKEAEELRAVREAQLAEEQAAVEELRNRRLEEEKRVAEAEVARRAEEQRILEAQTKAEALVAARAAEEERFEKLKRDAEAAEAARRAEREKTVEQELAETPIPSNGETDRFRNELTRIEAKSDAEAAEREEQLKLEKLELAKNLGEVASPDSKPKVEASSPLSPAEIAKKLREEKKRKKAAAAAAAAAPTENDEALDSNAVGTPQSSEGNPIQTMSEAEETLLREAEAAMVDSRPGSMRSSRPSSLTDSVLLAQAAEALRSQPSTPGISEARISVYDELTFVDTEGADKEVGNLSPESVKPLSSMPLKCDEQVPESPVYNSQSGFPEPPKKSEPDQSKSLSPADQARLLREKRKKAKAQRNSIALEDDKDKIATDLPQIDEASTGISRNSDANLSLRTRQLLERATMTPDSVVVPEEGLNSKISRESNLSKRSQDLVSAATAHPRDVVEDRDGDTSYSTNDAGFDSIDDVVKEEQRPMEVPSDISDENSTPFSFSRHSSTQLSRHSQQLVNAATAKPDDIRMHRPSAAQIGPLADRISALSPSESESDIKLSSEVKRKIIDDPIDFMKHKRDVVDASAEPVHEFDKPVPTKKENLEKPTIDKSALPETEEHVHATFETQESGAVESKKCDDPSLSTQETAPDTSSPADSAQLKPYPDDGEKLKVVLLKSGEGFGFSLSGGVGSKKEKPLYVRRVIPGGVAEQSGLVKGDYIVSLNGEIMGQHSQTEAASLMRDNNALKLEILRPRSRPSSHASPSRPVSESVVDATDMPPPIPKTSFSLTNPNLLSTAKQSNPDRPPSGVAPRPDSNVSSVPSFTAEAAPRISTISTVSGNTASFNPFERALSNVSGGKADESPGKSTFLVKGRNERIVKLEIMMRESDASLGVYFEMIPVGAGPKIVVKDITPGSSAARCGLAVGDQLLEIANRNVRNSSVENASKWLASIPVNQPTPIMVARETMAGWGKGPFAEASTNNVQMSDEASHVQSKPILKSRNARSTEDVKLKSQIQRVNNQLSEGRRFQLLDSEEESYEGSVLVSVLVPGTGIISKQERITNRTPAGAIMERILVHVPYLKQLHGGASAFELCDVTDVSSGSEHPKAIAATQCPLEFVMKWSSDKIKAAYTGAKPGSSHPPEGWFMRPKQAISSSPSTPSIPSKKKRGFFRKNK